MKMYLLAIATTFISLQSTAQDCSTAYIQGYNRDTAVSISEAKRIIATSFAAITNCQQKLLLRSGNLFGYAPDGDVLMAENFIAPLDVETKQRLISKLKPGVKLMLDNMRYGDENKLVSKITFTILKGPNYLPDAK